MVLLWAIAACAHRVSWEVQPVPSYTLPSMLVAVVAEDRECKRVADEFVRVLSARPGVEVRPGAPVVLGVHGCQSGHQTTVEVESQVLGLQYGDSAFVRRRFDTRGWATGEVTVRGSGSGVTLIGRAEDRMRGPWVVEGDLDIPAALEMRDSLRRQLAHDLADQLAPLPETIRRMVYSAPEPGTARQLHNQAVEAERVGDLQGAFQLAMQAYAANPSPPALRYIEDVKAHAASVGYALKDAAATRQ